MLESRYCWLSWASIEPFSLRCVAENDRIYISVPTHLIDPWCRWVSKKHLRRLPSPPRDFPRRRFLPQGTKSSFPSPRLRDEMSRVMHSRVMLHIPSAKWDAGHLGNLVSISRLFWRVFFSSNIDIQSETLPDINWQYLLFISFMSFLTLFKYQQ